MNVRVVPLFFAGALLSGGLSAQPVRTPPPAPPTASAAIHAPVATTYHLAPEKRAQAIAYARARYRLHFAAFAWSAAALLAIIALRLGPRFRDRAESASRRRFVQAAVFVPLLLWFASKWGATGAAGAMLVSTAVFCVLWTVVLLRLRASWHSAEAVPS